MSEHTKGRLTSHVATVRDIRGSILLQAEDGDTRPCVAIVPDVGNRQRAEADARRLLALWNACLDIPTEALEQGFVGDLVAASRAMYSIVERIVIDAEAYGMTLDARTNAIINLLAAAIDKAMDQTAAPRAAAPKP